MKKKFEEVSNEKDESLKGRKITRKEAFKKAGYLAVSAATTMILLSNPTKANAQSADPLPIWP